MIIRRVGPLSLAKVAGALYGAIGLIAGAVFALLALVGVGIGAAAGGDEAMGPLFGVLFGVGAIVVLPVFYGAIGFLGGLIGAVLYNLLARTVGGVEIDVA